MYVRVHTCIECIHWILTSEVYVYVARFFKISEFTVKYSVLYLHYMKKKEPKELSFNGNMKRNLICNSNHYRIENESGFSGWKLEVEEEKKKFNFYI